MMGGPEEEKGKRRELQRAKWSEAIRAKDRAVLKKQTRGSRLRLKGKAPLLMGGIGRHLEAPRGRLTDSGEGKRISLHA